MWKLPDAIQLGPLPVPTAGLTLLLGLFVWYHLAGRSAKGWKLDAAFVEDILYRFIVGGIVGAKGLEILRSPGLVLANPISLLTLPRGTGALLGAVLGAGLWTLPLLLRRRSDFPRLLDGIAIPLCIGTAVIGLGLADGRALPVAIGFIGVATALRALRGRTGFSGHLACGLVVLGALVLVTADFFRHAPVVTGGLSVLQLEAAFAAGATYVAALWLERHQVRPTPGKNDDPGV